MSEVRGGPRNGEPVRRGRVVVYLLAGALASAIVPVQKAAAEPAEIVQLDKTVRDGAGAACRFTLADGRVTVRRIAGGAAQRTSPPETGLDCPDVGETTSSSWLKLLDAFEDRHASLEKRMASKAMEPDEWGAAAGELLRIGSGFLCGFLRHGMTRSEAAGRALAQAEVFAAQVKDEATATRARDLVAFVERIEAADGPPDESALPSECQVRGVATPIDDATWGLMQGRSWHPGRGCPARDKLAMLRMPFVDFSGKTQSGELIIAKSAAAEVLDVFAELYRLRFPIASMRVVDHFKGNDIASMAANNTSGFNCRAVAGTSKLSEHALGLAIDINPVQNPFVAGAEIQPPAGSRFSTARTRTKSQPGVILPDDAVVAAFRRIGWKWGGGWDATKDYQHFSASGR